MPRSASGVYSLPQPAFVAGTTILSASVNSDFSDIATALTQSVATTGASSMTGPLKAFAGDDDAPSYTYASDLTTGWYLSSAGVSTFVGAGTPTLNLSSAGLELLNGDFFDIDGVALRSFPIGGLVDWPPAVAAPNGWILAYGQVELVATYAELATLYGTTFGGDGVTDFGIPDYRGRVGVGRDNMGTVAAGRVTTAGSNIDGVTIGASGGAQNVVLVQANLPNVNFTHALDGTATPQIGSLFFEGSGTGSFAGGGIPNVPNGANTVADIVSTITGTVASGGTDTAHLNMQPSIIVNKIIFTGVYT